MIKRPANLGVVDLSPIISLGATTTIAVGKTTLQNKAVALAVTSPGAVVNITVNTPPAPTQPVAFSVTSPGAEVPRIPVTRVTVSPAEPVDLSVTSPGATVNIAVEKLEVLHASVTLHGDLGGSIQVTDSLVGIPPDLEGSVVLHGDLGGSIRATGELLRLNPLPDEPPLPPPPPIIPGGEPTPRIQSPLIQSAFQAETGDVWLILLTIEHEDMLDDIRIVNNTQDIASRGLLFVRYAFGFDFPVDAEDKPPIARLRIDNVDRRLVEAVRSISTAPYITVELVRAADPDTVEQTLAGFRLRDISWDVSQITGRLVLDDLQTEPYPAGQF